MTSSAIPDANAIWLRDRRIERVQTVFARRGIESGFVETGAEALAYVLARIPRDVVVGLGGSVTLRQIGLWDALDRLGVTVLNHQLVGLAKAERHELRRRGVTADLYVMGCNAISETGAVVVANQSGNAIAALAFGAKAVILVASVQKIVSSTDEAIARVFKAAAPANAHRSGEFRPPCFDDGICREDLCDAPNRLCNKLFVLHGEAIPGRVHLLLVGDALGL